MVLVVTAFRTVLIFDKLSSKTIVWSVVLIDVYNSELQVSAF